MFVFVFAFYLVFQFNFFDCIWKFGRRRENWPSDQGAAYFPINAQSSTLLEVVLYDTPPHVPPHIQIQMLYTENLYLYFKYVFAYFCTPRQADSSTACAHILHGKLIRWSETCIFCFCYHCIFCGMPSLWPVCIQANPAYIINIMHNGYHSEKWIPFFLKSKHWKLNVISKGNSPPIVNDQVRAF